MRSRLALPSLPPRPPRPLPPSHPRSIWGLIFLLEGLGTAHQLLGSYDSDGVKARFVNAVGPWWVGSWLAASAWQLAFLQQTPGGMWLALLFILLSLGSMAMALGSMLRLRAEHGPPPSLLLYTAYFLPTSINTGGCGWGG